MSGGLALSHKLVLKTRDYPGNPGEVTILCRDPGTKMITAIIEMSPITGDLPEVDARRDRPGHDVVAWRVLAVEHIWQHDYVLAVLGLRHPRVGPRRAEPGIDLSL